MAELKVHKVVSSLPDPLEASSVYCVRVGQGFDIYITNESGTIVAYSLNSTFAQNVGDGSATSFDIDHNFGTRDVTVELYENSGTYDTFIPDVSRPTVNRVTLTFAVAPTVNQYRVVIKK